MSTNTKLQLHNITSRETHNYGSRTWISNHTKSQIFRKRLKMTNISNTRIQQSLKNHLKETERDHLP
jgi:hypothetical protein